MNNRLRLNIIIFIVLCIANIFIYSENITIKPKYYLPNKNKTNSLFVEKIYCDGIIYHNQNSWCIWLNKHKIQPHNNHNKELKVISINETKAKVTWQYKDKKHIFLISPQQHYDSSNKIIYNNNTYFK